jgi:hypothetical protein
MSGGSVIRFIAMLALVGVLIAIGVGVYNSGVSAGLAQQGAAVASGAPVVVYPGPYVGHGWGWGPGFGIFGIFFWILGIFLIFALIRAAFGFGRWGHGRGGWGGHYARYGGPREQFEDWHRRVHESDEGAGSPPGGTPDGGRQA